MAYLVHCNLAVESYSIDYTLVGIASSREEALKTMRDYSQKADKFLADNKNLTDAFSYDPVNDPKYADYVISFGNGPKYWGGKKFETNKDIRKEVELLEETKSEAERIFFKKSAEQGLMAFRDADYKLQLFKFDSNEADLYIDEFNGMPKCLCSYSE